MSSYIYIVHLYTTFISHKQLFTLRAIHHTNTTQHKTSAQTHKEKESQNVNTCLPRPQIKHGD